MRIVFAVFHKETGDSSGPKEQVFIVYGLWSLRLAGGVLVGRGWGEKGRGGRAASKPHPHRVCRSQALLVSRPPRPRWSGLGRHSAPWALAAP